MNLELREHAARVLRHETTRSLPLSVLRERLHFATGARQPGSSVLEQDLAADPRFVVLRPGALAGRDPAHALAAAGIGEEVRVLLAEGGSAAEEPLGRTRGCLLDAFERCAALRNELSAVLGELEAVADRLAVLELSDDAATPSTTPLPGPPAPAPGARTSPPPASVPPRTGEYR